MSLLMPPCDFEADEGLLDLDLVFAIVAILFQVEQVTSSKIVRRKRMQASK